jgi:hypothetical protein
VKKSVIIEWMEMRECKNCTAVPDTSVKIPLTEANGKSHRSRARGQFGASSSPIPSRLQWLLHSAASSDDNHSHERLTGRFRHLTAGDVIIRGLIY